jgi:two-component system, cell cycle sensor histidine kinase and response regulator CckA
MLTVILGHCELMLGEARPTDGHQEGLTEIQKVGTSAAALTRQLLAFSRKQIIEPTLIDLDATVGNLRGMLGRLIGEDVKVLLGLRPGIGLVLADRGQVERRTAQKRPRRCRSWRARVRVPRWCSSSKTLRACAT